MNFLQFRQLIIKWCSLIILGILVQTSILIAQDTARFIGLGHLPGGTYSTATDVSGNGLVVVGGDNTPPSTAFRWTEIGGMEVLPLYTNATSQGVHGVSGDGSIMVGAAGGVPGVGGKALRWVGGTVSALPSLPVDPPIAELALAMGISYDGTIIVGHGKNNLNKYEALMWVGGGVQNLGYLIGGNSNSATDVSPDGSVIVGNDRLYYSVLQPYSVAFRSINGGGLQPLGTGGYYESQVWGVANNGEVIVGALTATYLGPLTAARWTPAGGWEPLHGTTGSSRAYDVSADGSIIVGSMNGTTAFIWDADSSARDLKKVLENEYHLDLTGWTLTNATAIDSSGTAIVGYGNHNGMTEAWYVKLPRLKITKPILNSLWIAGEKDTIKWKGGKKDQFLQIDFSADSGRVFNIIDFIANADTGIYVWDVPKDILSKKCMIRVVDMADTTIADTSDVFKIKPYVLTRDSSGQYEPYRKEEDQWGFRNKRQDMFPQTWYQQFDYQGIDPFTGNQYSQWQCGFVFASSISAEFPDWVSWVNTFGINACYDTFLGFYRPSALNKWDANKRFWRGSCFGIATSNALAFSYNGQFHSVHSNFPVFVEPITVLSNDGVKAEVNALFTHQFGNPNLSYQSGVGLTKTPTETLNDLKNMLKEDAVDIRTLSFFNNPPGSGGHAILAYGLEKDPVNADVYYVKVYDNSYPASNNKIEINTAANGGNGSWFNPDWPSWGGNKWFFLELPSVTLLNNPTLPKTAVQKSPFILDETELQIFNPIPASTRIMDNSGNTTGFYNNNIQVDIPGSVPHIVLDGSETPPYGYSLPTNNYSVIIDNFTSDTVKTFFFTGNKTFTYKRYDAEQNQTDRFFFNGGISVTNPDQQSKTISLLNIINETTQEKLFAFSSIELAQNDSVKIENPDSTKIKLISYGTTKDYDIEINYVTENGIGRFGDSNIPLSSNTTHTIIPDWANVTETQLKILVDEGNDGTVEDTLSLTNELTGIGNDQGSLIPTEFRLEQNYPNPFNPTTKINWQSPIGSWQTLKVYDLLGREVATLVNEYKPAGRYEVELDASHLSSGVYFYKLQAGEYFETKKMILIR